MSKTYKSQINTIELERGAKLLYNFASLLKLDYDNPAAAQQATNLADHYECVASTSRNKGNVGTLPKRPKGYERLSDEEIRNREQRAQEDHYERN
tara:strand:- start:147 stop:431 length:285 start_codon:yes stop_codon:yes gene_type:complete